MNRKSIFDSFKCKRALYYLVYEKIIDNRIQWHLTTISGSKNHPTGYNEQELIDHVFELIIEQQARKLRLEIGTTQKLIPFIRLHSSMRDIPILIEYSMDEADDSTRILTTIEKELNV